MIPESSSNSAVMKLFILFAIVLLLSTVFQNEGSAQTYPDLYKTGHFFIHYNADSVPRRKDATYVPLNKPLGEKTVSGDPDLVYDPENPGKTKRAVPYYIIDMGAGFETSLARYVELGLIQADREVGRKDEFTIKNLVDVYVRRLDPGTDGENNPLTGSVYISQNVATSAEIPSQAMSLQKVCAHELLHYVTSIAYSAESFLISTANFWWWESLATQGDRLVFPTNTPFEAEESAMDAKTGIQNIIHDSWDVCNVQPNWYISSAFLSFLQYYRAGKKAEFKQIFFYPAKWTNALSYVRSSLDDYVKAELGSSGLGQEYYDYMMFLLEHKAGDGKTMFLKIGEAGPAYVNSVIFKKKDTEYQTTYDLQVPYMSLRVLKVLRQGDCMDSIYTIRNLAQEGECKVQVFECTKTERKLIRMLDLYTKKDSMNIVFQPGKWTEIAVLSHSTHYASSARIQLVRYPGFDGTYEGRVEFNPDNLEKVDSRYTISISNLKFEIKGKNVTCDFEFHKEYPKDGFYAKGTALQGTIDPTGVIHLVGSIYGFTYPKGSLNCCDFPRVLNDAKCIKFSHNPYYWKFDGKVVAETNKITLKGFIAAGTNSVKFNPKSEKLYSFSTTKKQ
jgi:hypothetical protein